MQRLAYGSFMLLALLVFLAVRRYVPRPEGLLRQPGWKRLVLALWAFVGGTLGAKVPFVLGGSEGPLSAFAWLGDGKTITTALIGAYLAVEVAKWRLGIDVKTGDTFALPLACAMAVGRWGCFFNGCCHGLPTDLPWGHDFGDGVLRHPTQVYESLFHLVLAGVLLVLLWRGWLRTHHLQLYLIAYGAYRFATEFIRPEPVVGLGLTFYQWASVALMVGLSAQWVVEWWSAPRRRTGGMAG